MSGDLAPQRADRRPNRGASASVIGECGVRDTGGRIVISGRTGDEARLGEEFDPQVCPA